MSIPRNLSFLAENASSTGVLAVVGGGTGTATPSIVAGTNVTVTGTWPNQTIAASGGGGGSTLVISSKTAAYTVVAGDLDTIVQFTGTGAITCSLTAAATLGAGFNCWIWSDKTTGSLTIDPSGSETIAGSATIALMRGEGVQIVCDGTNFRINAVRQSQLVQIDNGNSIVRASATASYSAAIGANSSGTASVAAGGGAIALGGSYASGTDSFAAAIANNTSTYGAQGANSVAMGAGLARASGTMSLALMNNAIASGADSIAIGRSTSATAANSTAIGYAASAAQTGKIAISGSIIGSLGQSQMGIILLLGSTTNATPFILNSTNGTAGATNQCILANNQAMTVSGTVICRQSVAGSDQASGWTFTAVIRRGATAASTALVAAVTPISVAQDVSLASTVVAVTADTTNGGLAVTVTGIAATNLRWVATIQTTEVIFA